jgi:hypothetical protein
MSTQPKLFSQLTPIEASSIPRPGTEEFQLHIDEIIAAATEVIESISQWKSKGRYHQSVEVRERQDWRGKRNWFLRRSVHKDVPFETFKVVIPFYRIKRREDYLKITRKMKKNSLKL